MPPKPTAKRLEAFHDLVDASEHRSFRSGVLWAIVIAVVGAGLVSASTGAWAHEIRGRNDIAVDYSGWRSPEGQDLLLEPALPSGPIPLRPDEHAGADQDWRRVGAGGPIPRP